MKRTFQAVVVAISIILLVALWIPKEVLDSSKEGTKIKYDPSKQSELWKYFTIKEVGVDTE